MVKTLSLIMLLLACWSILPAQDMIFETYTEGVDFWLLIPYNQLIFHADGSDSRYQISVEVKGKGIKSRTLYNNQLVIPQRDWLNDAGIPIRFSAKLPAGSYTFSIVIKNTQLGETEYTKADQGRGYGDGTGDGLCDRW